MIEFLLTRGLQTMSEWC